MGMFDPGSTLANVVQSPFRLFGYEPTRTGADQGNLWTDWDILQKSTTPTSGPTAPLDYSNQLQATAPAKPPYDPALQAYAPDSASPAFQKYYKNTLYTDPESYLNVIRSDALDIHNQNLKNIERQYKAGLLDFDEMQDAIKKSRDTAIKQKKEGMSSNEGYFSAISPDAFQSQQGTYDKKVTDSYNENVDTINRNEGKVKRGREYLGHSPK